jgi:hypothetical protein
VNRLYLGVQYGTTTGAQHGADGSDPWMCQVPLLVTTQP